MTTPNQQAAAQAPAPGSDEYNAQMIALARGQGEAAIDDGESRETSPVAPMPQNGVEKFYNKETGQYDWAAHARDAEYRLNVERGGKPGPESDPGASQGGADNQSQPAQPGDDQAAKQVVDRAGLDFNDLGRQIATNGDIDESAYDAIEKLGIPKSLIEQHVELVRGELERTHNSAVEMMGGQEQTDTVLNWAAQNLSAEDAAEYNKMLDGPQWAVAVQALKAQYAEANKTTEPSLRTGGNLPSTGIQGYRSQKEMVADMSDPRYQSDPTFRHQVMLKRQNATFDLDSNAQF